MGKDGGCHVEGVLQGLETMRGGGTSLGRCEHAPPFGPQSLISHLLDWPPPALLFRKASPLNPCLWAVPKLPASL